MLRQVQAITSIVLYMQLAGWGCSSPSEPAEVTLGLDLTATEAHLAASADRFGLKLFREIVRQEPDQNIFISPLSVSMALGMTANGAAGATLDSMRATLELTGLSEEESNAAYQSLMALLTQADPQVQFDVANSIWYRQGLTVIEDFLQRCRTIFEAQVEEQDFSAPDAADIINGWVSDNTQNKIKEIVEKPIDPAIVMFLINAIYFKGTWTYEFDSTRTQDDWFNRPDGSAVVCRMMGQRAEFRYLATEQFQMVDLPYGGDLFVMSVLLPRPAVAVDDLVAQMTAENWQEWVAGMTPDSGDIHLPKFKLEYELTMNTVLQALGMSTAFFPAADFSRMVPRGGIWIDEVKHKTFVQVDEAGTEAAAVTVVTMTSSAGPVATGFYMRVDRPFIFVIRERTSGTLLFMGKIVEPLWEEG